MTEILAVFRSRTHALACSKILKNLNIPHSVVSTPKEANVGCGLSVKLSPSAFKRAKAVIDREGFASFAGYLK